MQLLYIGCCSVNFDEKVLAKMEDLLNETGYTLSDMINLMGQKNSKLLGLDDTSYKEFTSLYEAITSGKLSKEEKGTKLEEITFVLFKKSVSSMFDVYRNCRTSTNEIDLLIRWTENARMSKMDSAFPCFGDSFLCECKNYDGKVDVTYVGKFCYLMNITNTFLGIMVAWEGITARSKWSDSAGLIKKIALKENRYVIVLDKKDFERIYKKEANLFSIINDKYLALKYEINYDKYILKHDAEFKMKIK